MHMLVVAPQEYVKKSTGPPHTHRQRTTPPTPTHTRTRHEQHPKPTNEHLPQTRTKNMYSTRRGSTTCAALKESARQGRDAVVG